MRNRCLKNFVDFFGVIVNALDAGKVTQREVAEALDRLGVKSAAGHIVSASHVSNAIRKSIKKIGPAYSKPKYVGKNHYLYGSKPTPMKDTFASLRKEYSADLLNLE